MNRYRITPPFLMLTAAFILIDGSWFAVLTVLSALMHELAHIAALKLSGGVPKKLRAGGAGLALNTDGCLSYRTDALVAAAGPCMSALICAVFFVISRFYVFNSITVYLTFANFALFALNALPIYPLDGGRVLYSLLCLKLTPRRAGIITRCISFIFLLPLGIISVIILIRTEYNLSLLIICIYIAVLLIGAYKI